MPSSPKQPMLHTTLPLSSKERSKLRATLLPRVRHGGQSSIRRRKTARPFATNVPLHLVLKSKRARGMWSLLHRKNKARVQVSIYQYAERFKIKVYSAANVGNHLHLLVKAHDRKNLADFLRVLAGRIAVTVTGAYKGVKKIGKFWDFLTWSRLVNWGKDFHHVRKYVLASEVEGIDPEKKAVDHHSRMIEPEWNLPWVAEYG